MLTARAATEQEFAARARVAWWRPALLVAVLAAGVAVAVFGPPLQLPVVQGWVRSAGPVAPLLYVACYVAGALLLVPRSLLSLTGGLLFGAVAGTLLAVLGATLAALACFLLARAAGGRSPAGGSRLAVGLRRVDKLLSRRGWRGVVYLRLIPLLPYSVVNYGCALTRLRPGQFVLGTAIGCLPGTALLVVTGAALS
jgi:uncharacterized membrane protein YdjX (TVP38/TMEM64 family)